MTRRLLGPVGLPILFILVAVSIFGVVVSVSAAAGVASATTAGFGLGVLAGLTGCAAEPSCSGAFVESAGAAVSVLATFTRADDFGSGLAGNSIVGVAARAAAPAFSGFRAGATGAGLGAGAGL